MTEQEMMHTPLYLHSAAYAQEHGERDLYRTSHLANIACRAMIDQEISNHFDGMHLQQQAITDVLDAFGVERTLYVLANTVQMKAWDGRFSADNRCWANTIPIAEEADRRQNFVATAHPAILDGFIAAARKEIERRQAKKSLRDQLRTDPQHDRRHPRQHTGEVR